MMAAAFSLLLRALLMSIVATASVAVMHHGQHGSGNMLREPRMDKDIEPGVIGKVRPVFFERASKVVVQLIKEKLSKARLGDLETYADGTSISHDSLRCAPTFIWCNSSRDVCDCSPSLLPSLIIPQYGMSSMRFILFLVQCQSWAPSTSL